MKILALEREIPGAGREQFELHGRDEARTVWDLYQRGMIRELYFRGDQHTAVLMLESASADQAALALAELPFVREGLISFDLIPLTAYTGFGRLFETESRRDAKR